LQLVEQELDGRHLFLVAVEVALHERPRQEQAQVVLVAVERLQTKLVGGSEI